MFRATLYVILLVLLPSVSTLAQGTIDEYGNYHPTEDAIAKNKRIGELLHYPRVISLRLLSQRRDGLKEEPSTTPSPYTIDQRIHFELFVTQNSSEEIVLPSSAWPYREYRPELIRDGDLVPYAELAQAEVEKSEKEAPSGSMGIATLIPGREILWSYVQLEDWYKAPLKPGHYQLTVRKRFARNGDWVESNPVTFDVVPRKAPAPIPDGVSIRLVPQNAKGEAKGQPYRMAADDYFAVEIINNSDRPLKFSVIDAIYGHRLQLLKDGKLVPYLAKAAKLIESKDSDPRLVELGDLVVPPKTTSQPDGVSLKQWYGQLAPGVYRITDRRRFEIGGPWTKESDEIVLEIIP